MILRFIYSPFVWLGYSIFIFFPLMIFGWILVPIALLFRAYDVDLNTRKIGNNGDPIYYFTWAIMAPYQNVEDGFYCKTYFDYGFFWTSVLWSCMRNPVNGLRTTPYLSCKVDPTKIEFVGTYGSSYELDLARVSQNIKNYRNTTEPHWYFAWHGFYTNIFIQYLNRSGKLVRLNVGWKIVPYDVYGVSETRKYGAKFAQKWKVID